MGIGTGAVVIGAGIAGLAMARTMADRFGSVTVVDRDNLPGTATPTGDGGEGAARPALLTRTGTLSSPIDGRCLRNHRTNLI